MERFTLSRFIKATVCALIFWANSATLHSSDPKNQTAYDQLYERLNESEWELAKETLDSMIESLRPVSSKFPDGTRLNDLIRIRAKIHKILGNLREAENGYLEAIQQIEKVAPPNSSLSDLILSFKRDSLADLVHFSLATGNMKRASEKFQEFSTIIKEQVANPPHGDQQGLSMSHSVQSTLPSRFFRESGDYEEAIEFFNHLLISLENNWTGHLRYNSAQLGSKAYKLSEERSYSMYLLTKVQIIMDISEFQLLLDEVDKAIEKCEIAEALGLELLSRYEQDKDLTLKGLQNNAMALKFHTDKLEREIAEINHIVFDRSAAIYHGAGDDAKALELATEGMRRKNTRFDFTNLQSFDKLRSESINLKPEAGYLIVGDLASSIGDYEAAESAYEEASLILKKNGFNNHSFSTRILESQALLARVRSDENFALALVKQATDRKMGSLTDILAFADEQQRLRFRNSIDTWSLAATFELSDELSNVVLRSKGAVLETILHEEALNRNLHTELPVAERVAYFSARRKLLEISLEGSGSREEEKSRLLAEVNSVKRRLNPESGAGENLQPILEVEAEEVSRHLPKDGALVEFIRYNHFAGPGRSDPRYGAVILRADQDPVFVKLGAADRIELDIDQFSDFVRNGTDDNTMEALLRRLFESVFEPLLSSLPKPGSTLVLSPDGALNFLSFATLISDDGRFLGEVWPMVYVASGRDLLKENQSSLNTSVEIFSNPTFSDRGSSSYDEFSISESSPGGNAPIALRGFLSGISLPPLPGTVVEERNLKKLISDWTWAVSSHAGSNATESKIYEISSPGILHLATHGFFLPGPEISRSHVLNSPENLGFSSAASTDMGLRIDNPMLRSGIALAGAEVTLKDWSEGVIPEMQNDGILTAAEIGLLDLRETWLVVLSACETGLGASQSGEGVLGLRRGLAQAGAKNLLLTLWPVDDEETARFMNEFYYRLDAGKRSPGFAATSVQAELLSEYRSQGGIASAVRLGGPFILSSLGRPF